ncbi:hypothetical protein F5Y14DRAFT_455630 [Nemania sp. NC0429]|nr:hypothetical protein F5Y14DRAFT_455630 [Nemania sp. NC0429]
MTKNNINEDSYISPYEKYFETKLWEKGVFGQGTSCQRITRWRYSLFDLTSKLGRRSSQTGLIGCLSRHPRNTEGYEVLTNSYLPGLDSDLSPARILLLKSKVEVAAFVLSIRPFDGITVGLRSLGASVFQTTAPSRSLLASAGRPFTSFWSRMVWPPRDVNRRRTIGGLATQGGLSIHSSREGFICDNAINFEIVVASGEILNANARENHGLH